MASDEGKTRGIIQQLTPGDDSLSPRRGALQERAHVNNAPDLPYGFKPLLARDVIINRLDDSLVVMSPETGEQFVCNETAAYILSCCNGKFSIRGISTDLVSRYAVDESTAEADVRSVIRELCSRQIVCESSWEEEELL